MGCLGELRSLPSEALRCTGMGLSKGRGVCVEHLYFRAGLREGVLAPEGVSIWFVWLLGPLKEDGLLSSSLEEGGGGWGQQLGFCSSGPQERRRAEESRWHCVGCAAS